MHLSLLHEKLQRLPNRCESCGCAGLLWEEQMDGQGRKKGGALDCNLCLRKKPLLITPVLWTVENTCILEHQLKKCTTTHHAVLPSREDRSSGHQHQVLTHRQESDLFACFILRLFGEETHVSMGRTCQFHAEWPRRSEPIWSLNSAPWGNPTKELAAVRRQCKAQLHLAPHGEKICQPSLERGRIQGDCQENRPCPTPALESWNSWRQAPAWTNSLYPHTHGHTHTHPPLASKHTSVLVALVSFWGMSLPAKTCSEREEGEKDRHLNYISKTDTHTHDRDWEYSLSDIWIGLLFWKVQRRVQRGE